jgi:hypothetical protein
MQVQVLATPPVFVTVTGPKQTSMFAAPSPAGLLPLLLVLLTQASTQLCEATPC